MSIMENDSVEKVMSGRVGEPLPGRKDKGEESVPGHRTPQVLQARANRPRADGQAEESGRAGAEFFEKGSRFRSSGL